MNWKNRIVRVDTCDPNELTPNPQNWRIHTPSQEQALKKVMGEVGWVGQVLWNERTGHIIDGHDRVKLAIENGDAEVPRLVVDLSEEEEKIVLATFDPIGEMAAQDWETLEKLVKEIPDWANLFGQSDDQTGEWCPTSSYRP